MYPKKSLCWVQSHSSSRYNKFIKLQRIIPISIKDNFLRNCIFFFIIIVRAIFASRPSVALVIFFDLKSPTLERHLSSFYLIRHEPMRKSTTSLAFYCRSNFCLKTKCCTCNLFWLEESHIGKTPFLFLPYKVWANEKEYH